MFDSKTLKHLTALEGHFSKNSDSPNLFDEIKEDPESLQNRFSKKIQEVESVSAGWLSINTENQGPHIIETIKSMKSNYGG